MRRLEKIPLILFLFFLLGVAASQVHSFDIFWQLQSGRYMAETRAFIFQDTFSLASTTPRFEHCWLHDLVFFGAYSVAGYGGISWLKGLLLVAAGALTLKTALLRSASIPGVLLLSAPALLLTRGGWLERPQLWTFFFLALFLLLYELYRRREGRLIWALVPLTALWANFHAGVILVFPLVLAWLVGEGVEGLLKRPTLTSAGYRRLGLVSLTLPLAVLLTPYGTEVLAALVASPKYGEGSGLAAQIYNMDWRSTSFSQNPLFFIVLGFTAFTLLMVWRKVRLADVFLLAGLALMGMTLERHLPIFFFGWAAIFPRYADELGQKAAGLFRLNAVQGPRWLVVGLAMLAIIWQGLPTYRESGLFDTGLRTWHYPVQAAEFVRANNLPGNLYNTYDWGGYLMWTLFPKYQVFWDGRSSSPQMFSMGLNVARGEANWERILNGYQVNTVISKACTVSTGERYPLLDRLRQDPDWALVFADQSALVFVRKASVAKEWLTAHRLPEERVDDSILSESKLLVDIGPWRYMAYWEMARIHMARKEYRLALEALEQYLSWVPVPDPIAESYYRTLYPLVKKHDP